MHRAFVLGVQQRDRIRKSATFCYADLRFRYQALKRIPGRLFRQLQVTDIDAEPRADASSHGNEQHVAVLQDIEADARDDLGRAGHAREAMVEVRNIVEIVDQDHVARSLAAEIPA